MSTPEQFVQAELERTGKRLFTVAEVVDMTERFIAEKQAAAEPFEGWKSDEEVDALLGIQRRTLDTPAGYQARPATQTETLL